MTMQLSREEVVARLLPRVAEVVQTLRQVL